MTETAIRQEIHGLIDNIPVQNLYALRPLLNILTVTGDDDDILSDEEQELLAECRRDRIEHPENFISLEDVLKKRLK